MAREIVKYFVHVEGAWQLAIVETISDVINDLSVVTFLKMDLYVSPPYWLAIAITLSYSCLSFVFSQIYIRVTEMPLHD